MKYLNGYIYEGEFNKDFPNGEGKLVSPNNEVYQGHFKVILEYNNNNHYLLKKKKKKIFSHFFTPSKLKKKK